MKIRITFNLLFKEMLEKKRDARILIVAAIPHKLVFSLMTRENLSYFLCLRVKQLETQLLITFVGYFSKGQLSWAVSHGNHVTDD